MATPYTVRAYQGWIARNRRTWRSAMSYAVLGPLLSLAAMGLGFGSLVARRDPSLLGGMSYDVFLAPGMLAAAAMQTATGEATWPVMSALRWDRSYHAMLAAPLSVAHVFYGHLLWMATRIATMSVAFLAAALLLGVGMRPQAVLAAPAAVLTGMAFATPIAAWAVGRDRENTFAVLYRCVVMPLFLFSGTFFPLAALPAGVRVAVQALPLWHGVELCRGLVVGDLGAGSATLHTGYLLAVTAAGVLAGRRTFAKALAS